MKQCSAQTTIERSELTAFRVVNYDDDTLSVVSLLDRPGKQVIVLIEQMNCKDCVVSLKSSLEHKKLNASFFIGNCFSYTCRKSYIKDFGLSKETTYFDFSESEVGYNESGTNVTPLFAKLNPHPSPCVLVIENGVVTMFPYSSVFKSGSTELDSSFLKELY